MNERPAMRDHLLLYVNGQPVRAFGEDAFLMLSEFLRRRRRLTGTKVVCAEGDCGSCSVLVGRVEDGKLRYGAVTSCIGLMMQLDGTHVVTVEGLKDGNELNAIQKSMVECHGAQCGFCTPGFVVSLYDLMQEGQAVTAQSVTRGLVGNLCRCTGYDSIVKAALRVERGNVKSLDEMYAPEEIIKSLREAASEEVCITVEGKKVYKPVSLASAVKFRAENPTCSVIAGATDLGVVYNKRLREIDVALSLTGIEELRGIEVKDGAMGVGAAATLTELEYAALEYLPELGKFLAWFGSPLIKNAGTLGGNLVTGSPIGDTPPAMMVLEAEVEIAGVNGLRTVPMNGFYTGYRKTVLGPDELVKSVRIPLLAEGDIFKLFKVSRRKDLDISTFSAAIWLRREAGKIADVRIAYGGVGPRVLRMSKTEALLKDGPATLEQFERAAEAAKGEVTPISDVRGSENYRRVLAGNILLKFWHEAMGDGNGNGDRFSPPDIAPRLRGRTSPRAGTLIGGREDPA